MTVYAANSSGNAAPMATIAGPLTRLEMPDAVAVDARGNIYVANNVRTSAWVTVASSIQLRLCAGSNGNVAPAIRLSNGTILGNAVIQGSLTDLDQPSAIAIRPGS